MCYLITEQFQRACYHLQVGQSLMNTSCTSCFVGVITAGDVSGPHSKEMGVADGSPYLSEHIEIDEGLGGPRSC